MTGSIGNPGQPKRKTRGRPSIYDPKNVEQVRKYALLGLTYEQMADLFDVSVNTFLKWVSDNKDFNAALKEGSVNADAEVAASLYERARGYSHKAVKIFCPAVSGDKEPTPVVVDYVEHYPPDTAAARIWLFNRQRSKWRDVVQNQVNLSGEVGIGLNGISVLLEAAKQNVSRPEEPSDE